MTKNVFSYLSCGFKVALRNFKNLVNLVIYWVYIFAKILSIIFIPLIPAVILAKYKIGNKESNKINLIDSLGTVNSIKKYWNAIFILFIIVFLSLSSILTIGLIFGSLYILGITNMTAGIILMIPCIIALVLFLVLAYSYLYPSMALINVDFDATTSLKKSLKLMKNGGKFKACILSIISLIIKSLVSIVIFIIPMILISNNGFDIVSSIVLFIFVVVFIFVYPFISYALLVAKVSFMSDLISNIKEDSIETYSDEETDLVNILNESSK